MGEPTIYLCRHGDTAWSTLRRLAGRNDLPLTEDGEVNARRLGERLRSVTFDRVVTSPLSRARRTAELAGFGDALVDERLIELDFGRYEGRMIDDIRREHAGWTYLRDGCPGGEGPEDIGRRADSLLADLLATSGRIALFGHSVILRVIAARYLGFEPGAGRRLMMSPSAFSILGYDHVDDARAIAAWNVRDHLEGQAAFA
jgi:broad specificity phosphatase PhoE